MKKVMKKSLCALLALAMVCTGLVLPGTEARADDNVSYIDESGASKTQNGVTALDSETDTTSNTTWEAGWYIVKGAVTYSERITVSGEVHLILADGCTLTAEKSINVPEGASLTIYAQSEGNSMGKLEAKGEEVGGTDGGSHAAIGGNCDENVGTITINGGNISADSNITDATDEIWYGAAGIGGAYKISNNTGLNITINGGIVNAVGGKGTTHSGAGIGGGYFGGEATSFKITINGGTVTAKGSGGAAGIGTGSNSALKEGEIKITGGTVNATAEGGLMNSTNRCGAGIGEGYNTKQSRRSSTITISGGTVTAKVTGVAVEGANGIGQSASTTTHPEFSTGENGNAVIYASSIGDKGSQTSWSGIIFEGNEGTVYGEQEISDSFEVKSGETLNVPSEATLTVNGTLTNNGTINVGTEADPDGKLVVKGSVSNSGTVEVYGEVEGNISGGGEVNYHYRVEPEINFVNATYGTQPDAKEIDIANTGLDPVDITGVALTKGTDFTLNDGTGGNLEKDGHNKTWTLQPKEKLSAGSYEDTVTVTYKVENSEKERTATAEVKFTVDPVEATVTPPTSKGSLTYNGDEQELVTRGSVTPDGAGTMKYSLTGDPDSYTADIPTGREAKEYTVYWKIEGADEANYTYTGGTNGTVTVNIAKSEADVTTTEDTIEYTYGTEGGITLEVTVAPNNAAGIALTAVEQNQVLFEFEKESKTATANVNYDASGTGAATYTIAAAEVKEYFKQGVNTVKVSYGGSGNLSEGSTTITVTVNPKTLNFTFTPDTKAYDGTTTVTGTLSEPELVGEDDVTATPTATVDSENASESPVNVNVSVELSGADASYYKVGTVDGGTVTISKADIPEFTKPTLNAEITYTGEAKQLIASDASGLPVGASIQYYVGEKDSETEPGDGAEWKNNYTDIKATEAGTYTVWYKVTGGTNYKDIPATEIGTATISKAAPSYTAPTAKSGLVYTGEALDLVTAGTTADGTIKYALGSDSGATSEYGTEIPKAADAGDYHVWYKVEGNENHADVGPQKIEVTIGKATSEVTVGEVTEATYGSEIKLTATVSAGGIEADKLDGTLTFKVGETSLGTGTRSENTWTLTIGAAETEKQHTLFGDGSNTQVTAEYSGNGNIEKSTSEAQSVTVEPKELTFKFEAEEKIYDGEKDVTGTLTRVTDLVSGDTVTATYKAVATSPEVSASPVEVNVTVTLDGKDAQYYKAKDPEGVTVKIVRAENNSVTAPVEKTDLTYNGKDQELIQTAGRSENGTMKYFVGESAPELDAEGWKGEITGITGKDAGKYKVWYYVDGDDNHNDTEAKSIEVKIEQKEVGLTWSGYEGLTYTGKPQNVTATAKTDVGGETVNVTVTGGDQTDAGSYEAEATELTDGTGDADNYKLPASVKQSYTIKKAPVSFTVTGNEVTYDTKTHTATVTQKDSESPKLGDGDFSVTYGDDNASSETNAGEYTIHVQLSNNNFKFDDLPDETREKTLTEKLTIKQAELTLEVSGSGITYGDTLSKSVLTGKATIGEGTVISGEWAWDATDGAKYPTVKTDSGKTEYTVKFTPTSSEAENFTTDSLSTEITITVNKKELTPVVVESSVESRDYDGTTDVTGGTLTFDEDLSGEPFSGNKPSATGNFEFVDKNVGTNKHVNVKGITLDNSTDYALKDTTITDAVTNAEITAKEVTLTWQDYEELIYSGTAKNVTATTENFVADDDVSLSYKDNDKVNAGTYTATAELVGADAGNYTISNNTQEYTIGPAEVSFTIGNEAKADWASYHETNGDPNPEGYKLTGEGTDYALTMTYDSFYHAVEVKQTAGEAVTIEKKAENGYCVTYKRVKDAEGKDVTEAAIEAVRNAGTYEVYVTINPVSSSEDVRNYVFSGHEGETSLKIGTITVNPYEITVAWTHLSYVYHGHPMHPNITVLNAFKNDLYTGTSLPTDFDPDTYKGNRVIAFGATAGSDVGEYTVTAKLYGANAGNYTVTDPDETVNIVPAPVTFTVGDNIWVIDNGTVDRTSVTLRPTWGAVTTDPDTAVHDSYPKPGTAVKSELNTTIVYKKDGVEYTVPTEAGTYEVWAEIGNKNFRHSATSDGASHNVGELIITTDRNSVRSYTVTFDPDYEGATGGPADITGVFANQTVVMPAIGVERQGHIFQGWSYGGRVYMPNEEFHMPSSDVTFKAQWLDTEDIRSVGGTVMQEREGDVAAPVLGATVTLKQGSNEIGETVTDGEGNFSFENLVPGIYNLEVRYHNGDVEVVKTYLVDVEGDSSLEGEYVLPGGALNTVVEADVTAVVDLESIVEKADDEGIYTTEDAETVNEGGSVEFKMTVKGTEATPEQIEEIPVPEERIGMVLDMELTKTVTDTSGSKTESDIEDTKTPITTVIHLSPELQGKSSYTIYRFHDLGNGNDMQTITTSASENGEYLKVIREGTAIELHARLYSTYVLTWAQRSGGGGGSAGLEVELPESVVGGKVSADRPTANPGDRVTLTVTASDGFAAGQVHVYTASGTEVEVTVNDDGTYSFTMPNEAVVVTVGFGVDCKKDAACPIWPYTDAAPTQWYHDGVHYVLENGIMDGYGNNVFKPSATLSRAMVAEMLYKMNGRPAVTGDEPFDDVDEGDWYRDAVIWANANGYITGYGDGTFRPETAITREQLATIMLRYERKHSEVDEELVKQVPSLPDAETTGEWYVEGVNWAVAVGIIGGRNVGGTDYLLPASTATRAEAATMVMRWIEKVSTKA